MGIKETYIGKANYLIERLLGEEPADIQGGPGGAAVGETGDEDVGVEPETTDDTEETEKGQAQQVEIFFDSLDEKTQKILLNAMKEALNVADDDEYGYQEIINALAKKPLIALNATELVRKLNIDI